MKINPKRDARRIVLLTGRKLKLMRMSVRTIQKQRPRIDCFKVRSFRKEDGEDILEEWRLFLSVEFPDVGTREVICHRCTDSEPYDSTLRIGLQRSRANDDSHDCE